MHSRSLLVALFPVVSLGGFVGRRGDRATVNYLATFEGLPTSNLPVLSTAVPPSPYQGLNYQGAVVVSNPPAGQYVTDLQTTQGTQSIAANLGNTITLSVPNNSSTFSFSSGYLGLYLSTYNSAVLPALDGTLVLTGTKSNGSLVTATHNFTAVGNGTVKAIGVVTLGRALLTHASFTTLTGLKRLVIAPQNVTVTAPITALLGTLSTNATKLAIGVMADDLAYSVTTP